jgi:hypothetical protein
VCGYLKKMCAVSQGSSGLFYQPQVGFVDQVCSLEAARGMLPAQVARSYLPQFAIGQFHQARFGSRFAIAKGAEKTSYFAIGIAWHYVG